jgi:predicted enzyme related to lactoylglutathione lyase
MKMLLFLMIVGFSFCAGMAFQGSRAKPAAPARARATGIGGIFFKSENPAKLTQWYAKNLGIKLREGGQPGEPPMFEWREKDRPETVGITVWSLFPKHTKYFAPSRASFMINYRVDNLDRLLRQLREAGVQVDSKTSDEANGRFGWAIDPEGNRFELWEPK